MGSMQCKESSAEIYIHCVIFSINSNVICPLYFPGASVHREYYIPTVLDRTC